MYLATVGAAAPKPKAGKLSALVRLSGALNPALAGIRGLGETKPGDPSTFFMGAGLAGAGIALGVGAMGTVFFLGSAIETRSKLVKVSGYTLAGLSGLGLIFAIFGLTAALMEKRAKEQAKTASEAAAVEV